jgi:hypothetical protein
MHVGTSCEEVGLSNIISLDKLGPLSFMFNRTINTDAIYCTSSLHIRYLALFVLQALFN